VMGESGEVRLRGTAGGVVGVLQTVSVRKYARSGPSDGDDSMKEFIWKRHARPRWRGSSASD
jgi:hypothetical protein